MPYLYKRYGGFGAWESNTSLTMEVDILLSRPFPPAGRQPVAEVLRRAGFQPSEGSGGLAVWERDIETGEKLEFLVAHDGIA